MRLRGRHVLDERQVEELLSRVAVTAPDEAELSAMARGAAETERRAPRSRPLRFRGALVVGLSLLVGSGFGFGFSSWITEPGSAGNRFIGLGFLPAKGWTVSQSQASGPADAIAIAANVPLNSDDMSGDVPHATLASLTKSGVVVVARFTLRGDLGSDGSYPARELPLQFSDAAHVSAREIKPVSSSRLSRYRLRAGVGVYNVDTSIYFGGAPSTEAIASAQRQLNRLFVASEQITIATRDRVLRKNQPFVTLFGSLASGDPDKQVVVQGKECGPHAPSFRPWGIPAWTRKGGQWSIEAFVRTTTTFRAVTGKATSPVVTVFARPSVFIQAGAAPSQYEVRVGGVANFWRKRIDLQRFDARLGRWVSMRSVVLADSQGAYSAATVKVRVPSRTLIRAVLPLSQARPCYLAGYSNLLRT